MSNKRKEGRTGHWLADMFAYGPTGVFLIPLVIGILAVMLLPALSKATLKAKRVQCVVYCAQDQVFAEPIFKNFTDQHHVKVHPAFDSEAVKTVGLANRLLAEKSHPQCDVFWSNEELRTRQLAAQGVFRETNGWTAVGYRSRRIVINTNLVSLANAPRLLSELTNAAWRGRVALAYPLFGTTATHFLALRQHWGSACWEGWCRALAANKPLLVDGNSIVVKFVGRGEAWVGLTDSDDIAAGQREGMPIAALPLTEEMLLIPNTIALVRNAPHPDAAERLLAYLARPEVLAQLAAANALEGVRPSDVATPTLKPDWDALVGDLDAGTKLLKEIFLR